MAAELDRRSVERIRGPVDVAFDPERTAPPRDICARVTSRAVFDRWLFIVRALPYPARVPTVARPVTRVRVDCTDPDDFSTDPDDFTDGRTFADAIRMVPSFCAANVRLLARVEPDAVAPDLYALLYFAGYCAGYEGYG